MDGSGSDSISSATERSLSDSDFAKLRSIVHAETGITIGENRKSMMYSRLQRRLRETGIPTFKAYISLLSTDAGEMQELTNRVTTNETYFYRTPRIWSHFRDVVVPDFLAKQTPRQMKVWSAAASTGEEAHTIAAILEDVRSAPKAFDYSILGTDISSRVISLAQDGLYVGRSVARFQREDPDLFSRQMIGSDAQGYRVGPECKRRITFRLHNLLRPLGSGGPFDVVFLRNVLIYFSQEDQEKILNNIHAQMRQSGTLIIGESETLKGLACPFELVAPLIYRPAPRPEGLCQ